jgi:YgiT-type zinc finger domain-containing protein
MLSTKRVTRSFGTGSDLLVVENIPLVTCSSCGVSYFTAKTMHDIELIKAQRKSMARKRDVEVATFETEPV